MRGKGIILQQAKQLSPEDRLTFNRWLKGNAVVAFLLVAGLAVMVLAGSNSARKPMLADGTTTPDIVAAHHE
jgi:hypothetical protein